METTTVYYKFGDTEGKIEISKDIENKEEIKKICIMDYLEKNLKIINKEED